MTKVQISPEERNRGDRFLAAHARIERDLQRRFGGNETRQTFRKLVDLGSKKDSLVREYQEDLKEFADLRNAIVHERISPDYLIAIPLPEAVSLIEKIAALLTDPPKVYPRFSSNVVAFQCDDLLGDALAAIDKTGYSQFPVYEGREYVGLLRDGAIAKFLSAAALGKVCLKSDTKVKEAMSFEKDVFRGKFISKDSSLYDAEAAFGVPVKGGWSVAALFITPSGQKSGDLLGIITPYDILKWKSSGA